MQQTLSAYLFGFAFMNLFHGALADSFGRRPVILGGVAVFALASAGCALSESIGALVFFRALQGLSTGAGIVVSRAVIRDMFAPADAQRVMSQVTIFFGVAPAIAPIIGGWLFVHLGWHSIFWFLAAVGAFLVVANWRLLPETLHASQRQPFNVPHLMRGYWQLGADPRFLALALASGIPFNGMFLYVLSTPTFLGHHLGLGPTEFWWFFALNIAGIMIGSWWSGRLAGQIQPHAQVRRGFTIMLVASAINVLANMIWTAHVSWALLPIALFSFGWALNVPVVTLMVLDLNPNRRGMASSLQAVVGSTANGFVAGVVAPLVMHSTVALAVSALAMLGIGLAAWSWVRTRVPDGAS
jgi:DHA1 family bicyclomycin/chloramphenicol resistance-like MFS transporter